MKKKIKDLTLEEANKICEKKECRKCPLDYGRFIGCYKLELQYKHELEIIQRKRNFDLEKEVEVDE